LILVLSIEKFNDSLTLGESVASTEIKNPCPESDSRVLSPTGMVVSGKITFPLLIVPFIELHPFIFLSVMALIVPAILFPSESEISESVALRD
jgi:hypothetical protein